MPLLREAPLRRRGLGSAVGDQSRRLCHGVERCVTQGRGTAACRVSAATGARPVDPGRGRLPRGRQSSIGPMTDSAGEAARYLTRNAVDALPEGALERQLAEGRPLRVKLGVDPTTPDIHLGHTVVLRKLREFQDLGHQVVLIIGDYTARVGDPSGRSSCPPAGRSRGDRRERRDLRGAGLQGARPRAHRGAPQRRVARHADGGAVPLARTATVAQLLERDDFAKRYAAREPISILELLYPLLQGYDSVAIRADVELGGTDQKFNLLLARDVQQAYGVEPQSILTMPILPGIDGERKMSKSLGNYVGVTEPPEEVFGKLMRVPDAAMPIYYDLLLDEPLDSGAEPARRQARHGARADRAAARRGGRRARPSSTSSGCSSSAACRTTSRSTPSRRPTGRVHLPRAAAPTRSGSRARRAGACSRRAASRSTASRWRADRARAVARRRARRGGAAGRQAPLQAPASRRSLGAPSGRDPLDCRVALVRRAGLAGPSSRCYTRWSRLPRGGVPTRGVQRSLKTQQYVRPIRRSRPDSTLSSLRRTSGSRANPVEIRRSQVYATAMELDALPD